MGSAIIAVTLGFSALLIQVVRQAPQHFFFDKTKISAYSENIKAIPKVDFIAPLPSGDKAYILINVIKKAKALTAQHGSLSEIISVLKELRQECQRAENIPLGNAARPEDLAQLLEVSRKFILDPNPTGSQAINDSVSGRLAVVALKEAMLSEVFLLRREMGSWKTNDYDPQFLTLLRQLLVYDEGIIGQDPIFARLFPTMVPRDELSWRVRRSAVIMLDGFANEIRQNPALSRHRQEIESSLEATRGDSRYRQWPNSSIVLYNFCKEFGTPFEFEEARRAQNKQETSATHTISPDEVNTIREIRRLPDTMRADIEDSAKAWSLPPALLAWSIVRGGFLDQDYTLAYSVDRLHARGRLSQKAADMIIHWMPESWRYRRLGHGWNALLGAMAGGEAHVGVTKLRPLWVKRYDALRRTGINARSLSDADLSLLLIDERNSIEATAAIYRGMIDDVKAARAGRSLKSRGFDKEAKERNSWIEDPSRAALVPNPEELGIDREFLLMRWHPQDHWALGVIADSSPMLKVLDEIVRSGVVDITPVPGEFQSGNSPAEIERLESLSRDSDSWIADAAIRTLVSLQPDPREDFDKAAEHPGEASALSSAKRAAQNAPDYVLLHARQIRRAPWCQEVITEASNLDSRLAMAILPSQLRGVKWLPGLLERLALEDPVSALKAGGEGLPELLAKSRDPRTRVLLEMTAKLRRKYQAERPRAPLWTKFGYRTEIAFGSLLDLCYRGELTVDQAYAELTENQIYAVWKHPLHILNRLGQLERRPNVVGLLGIRRAMREAALSVVWAVNALHEQPQEIRFASVNEATSLDLYNVIVEGREEIWTSSFNGLFDRLLQRLPAPGPRSKSPGQSLLESVGFRGFRQFMQLAIEFNRLPDFLSHMDNSSSRSLLESFARGLDRASDPMLEAAAVVSSFASVRDKPTRRIIQQTLKQEYERVAQTHNGNGQALYGLLASGFAENAVVEKRWFRQMAKQYPFPHVDRLPTNILFDYAGRNIQQHYFYNDADGELSFREFQKTYGWDPAWHVEDKGTYVIVRKSVGRRTIYMYANKPNMEQGQEDIRQAFIRDRLIPTVIVHRGHSYHAGNTIAHIPPSAVIVQLGSCGGFRLISEVLKRSPGADIFSTEGTGMFMINDPIQVAINESLLHQDVIIWKDLWQSLEKRFADEPAWKNYLPPNKNVASMFIKAYTVYLRRNRPGQAAFPSGPTDPEQRASGPGRADTLLNAAIRAVSSYANLFALVAAQPGKEPLLLQGAAAIAAHVRARQTVAAVRPFENLMWDRRSFRIRDARIRQAS